MGVRGRGICAVVDVVLVDVDMAVFVLVVDALVMDMRKLGKSDGQLQRGNRSCLQCDCPRMGWKAAFACIAIALGWAGNPLLLVMRLPSDGLENRSCL